MATKILNFKLDESEIYEMKEVAGVFNMSVTDLLKNAIHEYLTELKKDPYYRLTANVQEASEEESKEILEAIGELTDDDLKISSTDHINI